MVTSYQEAQPQQRRRANGVEADKALRSLGDYTASAPADRFFSAGPDGLRGLAQQQPGRVTASGSLLVSDTRTTQEIKSSPTRKPGDKPRYYCERSRFTLAGPGEVPGTVRLLLAPCKSNACPYCGRVKMYQKRNRIYGRLESDRASGLAADLCREFVTTTVREGALTKEQAFQWLKPAMAYAIQMVRQERKYNKRYRRAAWSGCSLDYINDVDIQPGTGLPHIHALYGLRFPGVGTPGKKRGAHGRFCRRFAKELHYYLNNWLRKRLGLPVLRWREGEPYPYTGANSVAYVHVSGSREDGSRGDEPQGVRSAENAANYMALHNGKIWTDGREYPKRYRRFSTSRGYLPLVPRSSGASAWRFVRDSLEGVSNKLAAQGVLVGPPALADVGHDGTALARLALVEPGSYRARWALGLAASEPAEDVFREAHLLPEEAAAKMAALEDYWGSGADQDGGGVEWVVNLVRPGAFGPPDLSARFVPGVPFEAWQDGEISPSLAALAPSGPPASSPDYLPGQLAALVREMQVHAPTLTDQQAADWLARDASILTRKQELYDWYLAQRAGW